MNDRMARALRFPWEDKMKKLLSVILIIAIILTQLAACKYEEDHNKTDTGQNETHIEEDMSYTEMSFVYAGGDPLVKEMMSERVQQFNGMYAQYNIIEIPSSSGGYLDFVKTQDAIGEFPDMLDCRDPTVWVNADKLAEIPSGLVDLLEDPPRLYGKHYVAPISNFLASIGFYYNKSMFDRLGLEEPKTRAEFEALCEALKEEGISPIVQGGKDIWHMGFLWAQIWLEEVEKVNPNWLLDKRAGKVSFTDPEVIRVIDKLSAFYEKNYIDEDWLSTADNQLVSYLLAEKAAMFFSGSWMINQVREADPDFELGWFPMPGDDGSINLLYSTDLEGFALSKEAAEDPNKVALFEAFVTFFYEEENYASYLATVVMAPAIREEIVIDYDNDFLLEYEKAIDDGAFTGPFWNGKWGDEILPGGFRNYTYKAFQNKITLGFSSRELGEILDRQWETEVQNLD